MLESVIYFWTTLIALLLIGTFLLHILETINSFYGKAPFVPIPNGHIRELLETANPNPKDIFVDLGAGDGRILECAANAFGCRDALGYEIAVYPRFLFYLKRLLFKRYRSGRITMRFFNFRNIEKIDGDIIYMFFVALYR